MGRGVGWRAGRLVVFASIMLGPVVGPVPAAAPPGFQDSGAGAPPAPAAAPDGGSREETPSEVQELQSIGGYRVLSEPFGSSSRGSAAETFNPFEARKPRRFHGSIYEYHRNDNLDARNFFDPVGEPLPEFKRNQFGFQLGTDVGSRLSLFGSYEGLRIVRGSTLVSRVPSLAQRGGDFSELDMVLQDPLTGRPFSGNVIPPERIHPVSQRLLAAFPLPNRSDPERNFVNSLPDVNDADTLLFRADYKLNDDTKLLGRYSSADRSGVGARELPEFNSFETEEEHELELSLNRNFSDRVTGQFSFDFGRSKGLEFSSHAGQSGLLESLGIAGLSIQDPLDEGYPDLRISGYARFGDGDSPDASVQNRFSFGGNLGYALVDHNLQFDARATFWQLNNFRSGDDRRGTFSFGGNFTGDALADFLLGFPDQAERVNGSDRVDMRRAVLQFSVVDDWRVSPQLNLELGVSYTYYQPHRSIRPLGGFFPLLVEPNGPGRVVISGTSEAERLGLGSGAGSLVRPDRNNWAPRLALAYSPFGNNRLVLRASYFMFYDSLRDWWAVRFMGRNYPFFLSETAVSSTETPELDLSNPFDTAAAPAILIRGVEPDLPSPYYQFWRLVLQKRLGQQWRFDLGYHGSKGTNVARLTPGNVPLPGPGGIQERRPDANFGRFTIVSGGGSWIEHRLNLDLERQLAGGFSLKGGFDWTRQIDDLAFFRVSNPRDLAAERASVGRIPQFSAFFNYIVDLPFGGERRSDSRLGFLRQLISGWRISGVTRFRTGHPFTVDLSGDPNNDGLSGDRPDRIGSGVLDGSPSVDQWFEVNDFVEPAAFTFGNSGRNILKGPAFQTWDIALSKRTSLADGHFLEFRVEFFNAFNHVNFQEPERSLGTSSFGQIFGASRAREIEIALKYSF